MKPRLVLRPEAEADLTSAIDWYEKRHKGLGARFLVDVENLLTTIENKLLGSSLSEFHSGYRIYSTSALRAIPFERNDNGFSFDTDIIIQFKIKGLRIKRRDRGKGCPVRAPDDATDR